jgi:hypothetical protein
MQQNGPENLAQLSIESMTQYLYGVVLPAMAAEKKSPLMRCSKMKQSNKKSYNKL